MGFNGELIFKTICHNENGGSYKLYYYPESKQFHCYTHCGDSFDLYELIQRNRKCEFKEALKYINLTLGIRTNRKFGFFKNKKQTDDWEILRRYRKKEPHESVFEHQIFSYSLLNLYHNICPVEWIDEGISKETMEKYSIKFDLTHNAIIIPHYSQNGELIGIRQRNLDEDLVALGLKYIPTQIENVFIRHPTAYNLYGLNINKKAIQSIKKIMIFESEKSVLKCDGFYGDDNFTVAVCGSNISNAQRDTILSLGVKEVFIAFDKEYHEPFSEESDCYSEKILSLAYKFCPYVTTYVLWDVDDCLDFKDSPCDKGKEVFEKLLKNKFEVETKEEGIYRN